MNKYSGLIRMSSCLGKFNIRPNLTSLINVQTRNFTKSSINRTTILCVRKDNMVVMAGDGQVSAGSSVVKGNARKVRRIGDNILVGFAGSTADAMTLLERLEKKLEEHPGQLMRACVELAKLWRSDKYLRRLEAVLLVADANHTFELTGNGDVLEPESGVMGAGSGGNFAQCSALALIDLPNIDAETIVRKSMKIAGDMCVYTNHTLILERIDKLVIDTEKKIETTKTDTAVENVDISK